MRAISFSVIIPTQNRTEELGRVLTCLSANTFPQSRYEVIVVNNGDTSVAIEKLVSQFRKKFSRLTLIVEKSLGAALARNRGAHSARYPYVVFIDDDVLIGEDFLQGYADAWQKYPDARIVGGRSQACFWIKNKAVPVPSHISTSQESWCIGHIDQGEGDKVLYPGGAVGAGNMSYRLKKPKAEIFSHKLGVFFLPGIQLGSEDIELCSRTSLEGEKVIYVADRRMEIKHVVAETRWNSHYLDSRYWLQGIELATVEKLLKGKFPDSKSTGIYFEFLIWDLTHLKSFPKVLTRFLTSRREWIRLGSYLMNRKYTNYLRGV